MRAKSTNATIRPRPARVPVLLVLLAAVASGCAATGGGSNGPGPFGAPLGPVRAAAVDGAASGALTLEEIFADQQWVARSPTAAVWSVDGERVLYDRVRPNSAVTDRHRIDLASGVTTIVADDARGPLAAGGWIHEPGATGDRALGVHAGNLFLWDAGGPRQLTRGRASVSSVRWSLDGEHVFFERGGSWWSLELDGASDAFELARFETSDEPPDESDGPTGFRAESQQRLFDVISEEERRARERREVDERRRDLDPTRVLAPLYVGAGNTIWRDELDPTGRYLVAIVEPQGQGDGARDQMPVWITEDADIDVERVRPHAGEAARIGHRLEWFDLETGGRVEVPLDGLSGQDTDPLAFLRATDPLEGPREVRARLFDWSPDGRLLALQVYSIDDKDRWTCLLDAEDATLHEIHRLSDEAWIGSFNEMGWVPGTSQLWFQSEESGWSHIHLYDADTGTTRALTSGRWETDNVVAAPDGSCLFCVGNRSDHGVLEVHRVFLDGRAAERLTHFEGVTRFVLSPGGERLLCTVSRALEPPELYLVDARTGAEPKRLTHTIEPAWAARPWIEPEYVLVPGREGRAIPARLYRPAGTPTGPRPAVLFVHGAGYLQNAHRGWSTYQREFMFHSFLVQQGFVVLDMDYRASAGYGRDWRTAIWRHMGEPELEDLVDGARWLAQDLDVDPERIGLYGGSYGGFMTLMALFKAPEVFACGAALRPVTDWAHYNDPYTARILHTPDLDPEAYRRSSPIEFAEGLEDPLLVCHGLVDSNVLAKDSVRLSQRLIELGVQDFEVMLYPAESHAFRWPSSWLDEYRRIWKLFDTWLVEPIGARAATED
ncbi:Prolyl tripeptidyl peptidase precursor [Planctomycetes bacterium Pla163]|uniref:Prolyl tripeptidyl peptidase n=1 Tax=Rohdeia mirabilis TaxID=2528008 RepID=A0A518D299_9BACT|nr:Prolyl tripeptidyl peptidase precursor [Planctomycetes bacterium Pla163]